MLIEISHSGTIFVADLAKPIDISLPLVPDGENPNCYFAENVHEETIKVGDFTGSVQEGGSVNYRRLHITPHGNGTHTECYGHITSNPEITIHNCLKTFNFIGKVVTVKPSGLQNGDVAITRENLNTSWQYEQEEALIIRTLPNEESKKTRKYSGNNPAYLLPEAVTLILERSIQHLLIDLPSVDRETDGGKLSGHKIFWNYPENPRKYSTISELIFVDNSISDGLYLLQMQIISIKSDASPSKPVLYKLRKK